MCCCTYRYDGIADADETAYASGVALQAYFEGRVLTKDDMEKCIHYWKEHVSEMEDPIGKKRDVCCEPFCIPCCTCTWCYEYFANRPRNNPFDEDDPECTAEWLEVREAYILHQTIAALLSMGFAVSNFTPCYETLTKKHVAQVYKQHTELQKKQVHNYKTFFGPVRKGTVCRAVGCRRVFGRRGLIFCTEGCCDDGDSNSSCTLKGKSDPAPTFKYRDIDDEHDASVILQKVLGDPPLNVTYRRWQWDEENQLEMVGNSQTLEEEPKRE